MLLAAACLCSCKESMSQLTERVFDVAKQQAFNMDARLDADVHPRSLKKDGTPRNSPVTWWCSGFFPGSVWYIYEYTGDESVLALARKTTAKLDSLVYNPKTDHDIGFQINCSYGNGYRLTGDQDYRAMMEKAAAKLTMRFSPVVGCTKSWDWKDKPEDYPVIIDNMMNLELLTWVGREFGVDSLNAIACTHANTTMKNHFRGDYTTFHGVVYDPNTGDVKERKTIQGYADDSAWARGQAWALYGYTMMFRETANQEYLDQAVNVANMILEMELPQQCGLDVGNVRKLKALLAILATEVPMMVDMTKLSLMSGVSRTTLLAYLQYLYRARLINLLYSDLDSLKKLQKPDKIYLENPNLLYVFSLDEVNKGTLREVFMTNQLSYSHQVEYSSRRADYTIDRRYIIEVGGKSKDGKQVADESEAFIAADNIEYSVGNKIPLWTFGFLY